MKHLTSALSSPYRGYRLSCSIACANIRHVSGECLYLPRQERKHNIIVHLKFGILSPFGHSDYLKSLECLDLGGVCLDLDLERGSMAFQGVCSTNARASPAKHKRAQGNAYKPWGNVAIRSTWTVDSDGLSILQCTSRMQAYF